MSSAGWCCWGRGCEDVAPAATAASLLSAEAMPSLCECGVDCSFVSVGVVGSKGEYEFMNDGREGSRTGRRRRGEKVEC